MRATLSGKIKDNGGLEWSGDVSHFLVCALEENGCGHHVPVQYFPHHLHCYVLFVCSMLRRAEMETLLRLPEGCANLSLSIYLTFIYVWVRECVCVCVLWGIMVDQTWLCGRCKFNHFFLQHISESDSTQVLRPITWRDIEGDVLYMQNWIFTSAVLTLRLTGMSVNL